MSAAVTRNGLAQRWPNLRALAQPYFDRGYADGQCWRLICELLCAGGFVAHPDSPVEVMQQVQQVWGPGDARALLPLVQPWDLVLMRKHGPAVQHPGLVVDPSSLIHVRPKAGVCIDALHRWEHKIFQLGRLRCFL